MAKDFSKLISDAVGKHNERSDANRVEEERRNAELAAKENAAISILSDQVRPLLEEAVAQCVSRDIPLVIEDNWTGKHGNPMRHQLSFWAQGPERRNAVGGVSTPRSHKAFFLHDGKDLRAGMGRSEYENHPHTATVCPLDQLEARFDSLLAEVLETYFKSVEEQQRYL